MPIPILTFSLLHTQQHGTTCAKQSPKHASTWTSSPLHAVPRPQRLKPHTTIHVPGSSFCVVVVPYTSLIKPHAHAVAEQLILHCGTLKNSERLRLKSLEMMLLHITYNACMYMYYHSITGTCICTYRDFLGIFQRRGSQLSIC